MATLLDAPKANPAKYEEFVAKQVADVRRRIRAGDIYSAAVVVLGAFAVYLFAALLVDRYVPTKPGVGWASLAAFVLLAGAYLYRDLFRRSRRDINPYYAAKQMEESILDAKNSVVNWIDLHEDEKLAGSLKTALGAKAAKDLKGADLSHVGEEKSFIAGAVVAFVFLLGSAAVYLLPPTRTEVVLVLPKGGDATVFSGDDVRFEARLLGRLPKPADPDSARLRIWYNPDDADTYEDRALDPSPDDKRAFAVTVKANQVRKGFDYQVRAGGAESPRFHITCKIIPILTGFEVSYKLPDYLKKADEKTNEPNLYNYYGTQVTLQATTNRTVKGGYVQIEGLDRAFEAEIPADRPDALRFKFPLEREGSYRIFFTTTEGDRNSDPQKYRIGLVDPKPAFTRFDVKYQYPDYLRWKPMALVDQKKAEIEAARGTAVTLTAKANRPVKAGTITFERPEGAIEPRDVAGEAVPGEPLALRFKLPPLDENRTAAIRFAPATGEGDSVPQPLVIRAVRDEAPQVKITKPEEPLVEIPINDALRVEGLATDDHGISRMNLRLNIVEPFFGGDQLQKAILVHKPYREGMEFKRDKDGSYPTRLEYRDQVEIASLRSENDPNLRIAEGWVVEYWLEAVDNCNIPPGPNQGFSKHQKFRVIAPTKPADAKAQQQKREQFEKEKKQFEKEQDKKNAEEQRDPNQPPPPQDQGQNEEKGQGMPGDNPKKDNPKKDGDPKGGQAGEKPQGDGQQGGGNTQPDAKGKPNADQKSDGGKGATSKGSAPSKQPRDPNAPPDTSPKDESGAKNGDEMTPEERRTQEQADRIKEQLAKNDPKPKGDNPPEKAPNPKESGEKSQPGKTQSGPGQAGKPDDKSDAQQPPPEPGELAREIGSNKDKMTAGQKEDVERLMRDKDKKDEMQKQLDRQKDKIQDSQKKEQFQKDVDEAKKKAREKDDIDELAKKSKSKDPMEAKAAQDQLDEKMQDPENRKSGEQVAREKGQQQDQKGGDPQAKAEAQAEKEAIEKAAEKGRQQNLEDAAKKMQSDDPKERQQGEQAMKDLQKDPAARKQAQEKKDELAKGAKGEAEKKDFEKKMDEAAEQGKKENVDKVGKEAESNDPRDRKQAQKDLDDLKKNDPEAAEKAEQKMEQAQKKRNEKAEAGGEPNGEKPKENPPKNKDGTAQKQGSGGGSSEGGEKGEGDPEQNRKDLNQLDREIGRDSKIDKSKQETIERLSRDPKLQKDLQQKEQEWKDKAPSEQAKKEMQERLDDAHKNADTQDKIDKDVETLTKKNKPPEGGEGKPKDGTKDGSKDGSSDNAQTKKGDPKAGGRDGKGDPKAGGAKDDKAEAQAKADADAKAQKAREELNEMAKDPAKRDQMEKAAKDLAKKNPQAADELQKAADKAREEDLKNAAQQAAKPGEEGKKGEQNMADMMKDPKTRDMLQKGMKEMADQIKDIEKRKGIEEAMKRAAEQARDKDLKDLADRAQKDAKEAEKAARDLKDLMDKDPAAKQAMKDMADKMNDPAVKKGLEDLQKKAEELAKKDEDGKKNEKGQAGGAAPRDGTRDGKNPDRATEANGEDKIEVMKADPKNRLKARELQLEEFKNLKDKKDLLKDLKMSPEEYERFLKAYEDSLAKQRERLKELEKAEIAKPRGGGGSILNRGAESVKLQGTGKDDPLERGGQTLPPPGFEDAAKRANGAVEGGTPK